MVRPYGGAAQLQTSAPPAKHGGAATAPRVSAATGTRAPEEPVWACGHGGPPRGEGGVRAPPRGGLGASCTQLPLRSPAGPRREGSETVPGAAARGGDCVGRHSSDRAARRLPSPCAGARTQLLARRRSPPGRSGGAVRLPGLALAPRRPAVGAEPRAQRGSGPTVARRTTTPPTDALPCRRCGNAGLGDAALSTARSAAVPGTRAHPPLHARAAPPPCLPPHPAWRRPQDGRSRPRWRPEVSARRAQHGGCATPTVPTWATCR